MFNDAPNFFETDLSRTLNFIDGRKVISALEEFKGQIPFDHCVIDDFFHPEIAKKLEDDFISYDDTRWFYYKNCLEDKKALNDWNAFPALTYRVFSELVSHEFISLLSTKLGSRYLPDVGLHGGGWHIHDTGGNLNPHLDYSIHPKLGLERKLNIIIYLSSMLENEHGGHLGLWSHDEHTRQPGELKKVVAPKFNRAVLFDTTQNSWHGMCHALTQPKGIYRKSLAVYYLTIPSEKADSREKALFAPREEQKSMQDVQDLIAKRVGIDSYAEVYRTEK